MCKTLYNEIMDINKLEQLLKEINHLVKQNEQDKKERTRNGENFNIFKICGIDYYELQHSSIIAELLNPLGSHGQGEKFLKLFMFAYGSNLPIDEIEYDKVSVKKEEWTEAYDGRMDIYVEYAGLPLLIIENKLCAKDQSIQLKKYKEDADTKIKSSLTPSRKYEIVYLTLDGKNASDDSGGGVDYKHMSYARHIVSWLDACMKETIGIPMIRETLLQYQNHIKQLTNQVMADNNKEQLFHLFSQYPDELEEMRNALWNNEYRQYVFEKYVEKELRNSIEMMGLEIDYMDFPYGNEFYVDRKDWKANGIRIFFGKEGNYARTWVGIASEQKVIPQDALECLAGDKPNEWWPYGTQWLPDELSHWDWPCFEKNMVNGCFTKYVISKVKEILAELDEKGISLDKKMI